ncbi:MAG: CPBP family glutamic-type intramembrane protease [Planctomycetota bacterium]
MNFGSRFVEDANETDSQPELQVFLPEVQEDFDLEFLVAESAADLGIRVDFKGPDSSPGKNATVQLFQNEGSSRSRDAADFIETRLAAANIELIKNWARAKSSEFELPIEQTRELLQPINKGSAILVLMPLVLLLMTVTGGVYPAIDLTAGERERNTMETLMALPVPRFRLLLAKYVAVVTVTMLTGLMNLLAMSVTLYALNLDKLLLGEGGFTIVLAAKLFVALSAFALFYSAVLLLLTSSAKSFKEAQAYLIPLLLLSIAPGLAILMPGWNLEGTSAAIPLINILLLSRELLEGTVRGLPAMVAIISTVLYGVSALSLAAQIFGKDAVAIGSRGRWHDLLQRPEITSDRPSLALAVSTLALLFPLYFIFSGVLGRGESEPSFRLVLSAAMTLFLFILFPLALLIWQRISSGPGFGINITNALFFVAAILFGLATWPWVFEIIVYANGLGIRGFDPEKIKDIEVLLAQWEKLPIWLVVLCLGVVPGICEEAFFRGFLFNGLKRELNATLTILISALAFGLFHVVLSGGAAPERLLPSTLMGLLLGWLAWRSNSVIPSMILHAVHNSVLLIAVNSLDLLAEWNIGQTEQEHLPVLWLVISAGILAVGTAIVFWASRKQVSQPNSAVPETS